MTEVLFYHLQRQPLEAVLPSLLERCLARGWRALVQTGSDERAESLDAHLWTYSDDSFLPHGTSGEGEGRQPVLLTTASGNPNEAEVRFFVDGVPPAQLDLHQRVVIVFDGNDQEVVEAARSWWKDLKGSGHEATYWQQNPQGRWEKKA